MSVRTAVPVGCREVVQVVTSFEDFDLSFVFEVTAGV